MAIFEFKRSDEQPDWQPLRVDGQWRISVHDNDFWTPEAVFGDGVSASPDILEINLAGYFLFKKDQPLLERLRGALFLLFGARLPRVLRWRVQLGRGNTFTAGAA